MSAPTIASVFDIDLPTSGFSLSEEEENHTSGKKNNYSEEDVKFISNYNIPIFNTESTYVNEFVVETVHSINDDLVIKIPSPPPESV